MKKQDVVKMLTEKEKKYFDLVWFARKEPEWLKDGHPSMPGMVAVQMKYPEEVEALKGEIGDWTHGFNSGCLAAFRLVLGLMGRKLEAETAIEEFPFLDT